MSIYSYIMEASNDSSYKAEVNKRKYLKVLSPSTAASFKKNEKYNKGLIAVFELDYTKFAKEVSNIDIDDALDKKEYKSVWDIIKKIGPDIDREISKLEKDINKKSEKCSIKFLEGDNDCCYYGLYLK